MLVLRLKNKTSKIFFKKEWCTWSLHKELVVLKFSGINQHADISLDFLFFEAGALSHLSLMYDYHTRDRLESQ